MRKEIYTWEVVARKDNTVNRVQQKRKFEKSY